MISLTAGYLPVHFLAICVGFIGATPQVSGNDSIDVRGVGVVEVTPDSIWVQGKLTGSGTMEEAKKIIAGYHEDINKVLADEAFQGIKVAYNNLAVKAGGSSQSDMQIQMLQMMGEAPPTEEADGVFTFSEDFRLTVTGVTDENFEELRDRMLQLASALSDKQITLGSGGMSFNPYMGMEMGGGDFLQVGLSDPRSAWKNASRTAFADAKAKAESLAEIAGGVLGPARSIRVDEMPLNEDTTGSPSVTEVVIALANMGGPQGLGKAQASLDKVKVRVDLAVSFGFSGQ